MEPQGKQDTKCHDKNRQVKEGVCGVKKVINLKTATKKLNKTSCSERHKGTPSYKNIIFGDFNISRCLYQRTSNRKFL